MKNALYTRIVMHNSGTAPTAIEIKGIIARAHALGCELVPFCGWSNEDLGMPGNPGACRAEAYANNKLLRVIGEACGCDIFSSRLTAERVLEDDEALAIVGRFAGWRSSVK